MFGFEEVLRDPFLLLIVVFMVVAFVTGLVLLVCGLAVGQSQEGAEACVPSGSALLDIVVQA
jgi:hypothetical protein